MVGRKPLNQHGQEVLTARNKEAKMAAALERYRVEGLKPIGTA